MLRPFVGEVAISPERAASDVHDAVAASEEFVASVIAEFPSSIDEFFTQGVSPSIFAPA